MDSPSQVGRKALKQARALVCAELRERGLSNVAIAERLGVTPKAVCAYLRFAGIPGRGGGRHPAPKDAA